jgi:Carboxypeptidase regulatory-like domain/Domain of unknown function (DUF5122) beta-propeller
VDNSAAAVVIQADGKIVVAGSGSDPGDGTGRALLARYQADSPPGTAPANSSPPTISGAATEGEALTANAGTWSGSTPINQGFQWRRCESAGAGCVDIAAATAATYALAAADVGHTIRVRETASNAYGEGSADSAATAVIRANPGSITGSVRNAKNGGKIANASVNCGNGHFAKTASDGRYSIANAASGTYRCTASANGYRPQTKDATVIAGTKLTLDFALARL